MSGRCSLREQLRQRTGAARARLAAVDTEVAGRRDEPPDPGDLFVLAETAEHDVEWAILERDPEDPRRLLVVPADTVSLVGSGDVAAPEDAARGPSSLRCAHAVWVDADAFDPERRTGFLDPETVERARRKCKDVAQGTASGTVLEREVDGEAEYREWIEAIEAARTAVPERPAEPRKSASVVPFRRPVRWQPMAGPLALAASILLLVSLGLGRQLMRSESERQAAVAEHRGELAERQAEHRRLADNHARDLARLEYERQQTAAEHQQRLAELEAAAQPKPLVNLPFVVRAAAQLRGGGEPLEVAPQASWILVILQVEDPERYPRYGLEIRDRAGQRQVWQSRDLEVTGLAELSVALPRNLLPDGRYQVRLSGMLDGRTEKLMEQALTITGE